MEKFESLKDSKFQKIGKNQMESLKGGKKAKKTKYTSPTTGIHYSDHVDENGDVVIDF